MGLLLSVLVACVAVVELLTFYNNIKRRVVYTPLRTDLEVVRDRYINELYEVRKRIIEEIERLKQNEEENDEGASAVVDKPHAPKFRLNSHEDIEIEFDKHVSRDRSSSPRRFVVTEKARKSRSPSPRCFIVKEDLQDGRLIQKSKAHECLPEFLVEEGKNSENLPRIVLKERRSVSPVSLPLPKKFIVTEQTREINFEEESASSNTKSETHHKRPLSPYPSFDLTVPRNSICNELIDDPTVSVREIDEEADSDSSKSPTPSRIVDLNDNKDIIPSNHDQHDVETPMLEKWDKQVLFQNFFEDVRRNSLPVFSKFSTEIQGRKDPQTLNAEIGFASNLAASKRFPPFLQYATDSSNSTSFESAFSEDVASSSFDDELLDNIDGVAKRRGAKKKNYLVRRSVKKSSANSLGTYSKDTTEYKSEKSVTFSEPEVDKEISFDTPSTSGIKGEPFWLIFSGEYTRAMNKDWHGAHFCCWQCDESLTGQRYVLRDDHPYCVSCYESVFANACEKCSRIIGIDSKDLSYKDKHWHEACFLCTTCGDSLVDKQFGSKGDRIYCGRCYDEQFASRCDGCHEIFRAGTKKMEYKTRQWHEKCFCCCVCKVPIGTQSFIPREQEIYCAKCYEEKFATRCIKCNKVITSGGVTYKNEPWHRECFTCTHCERSLAGERFTSRDDKPYCADCFGELFAKRCFACNKPITGIGGTKFISFEDRHWHNDCFYCASCRTSLVGRGFITDQEDIICPECAKQKLM